MSASTTTTPKTPRTLLHMAGLIAIAFVILHALGGREGTSVLSGTGSLEGDGLLGVAYAGAYLALVVVAPILVIAWGVSLALDRRWPTGSGSSPADA